MEIKVGVCAFTKKYYQLVTVVELQRTFYNIPREKTVHRWREEAPSHFEFTFKVFQGLTHPINSPTWRRFRGKLDDAKAKLVGNLQLNDYTIEILNEMVEIARILKSPLVIVQTPSRFKYNDENMSNAIEFFKQFDKLLSKANLDTMIGWEPRGNWLENYGAIKEICNKVPRLIHVTDPFFHDPAIIKRIVYFRLHGKPYLNYKYQYSQKDYRLLRDILGKIISEHEIESIYIMFNNVKMLDNAKEFEKYVKELVK